MTSDFVVQVLREAMMTAFWTAIPLLAFGFIVGIAISLLQIVTSIQDSAFSALPRLVATLAGFLIALPWMVSRLIDYTNRSWGDFSRYVR